MGLDVVVVYRFEGWLFIRMIVVCCVLGFNSVGVAILYCLCLLLCW